MRNLIFIVLIVLALVFAVFSIFKKRPKKSVKWLFAASGLLAAFIFGYIWYSPSWNFSETTGEFQVETSYDTYTDEQRVETYEEDGSFRWLNVAFWYPADEKLSDHSSPLLVFSHGSFGSKESNESQYRELASHGYVVCAIDHTYQCISTISPDGKYIGLNDTFQSQIMQASDDTMEDRERLYGLFKEWMAVRTADINFVIDSIIARADNTPQADVYQLVDKSRIGVMGHSLGGAAALGIGRMRSDISAVISLEAPFMCDVTGMQDGEFVWDDTPYPIPVLNVYTDSSWNILSSSPQYAQNSAMLGDSLSDTQEIYVSGAGHMTLTDLVYSRPPLCLLFGQNIFFDTDTYQQNINQAYVAFLDTYLKKDG